MYKSEHTAHTHDLVIINTNIISSVQRDDGIWILSRRAHHITIYDIHLICITIVHQHQNISNDFVIQLRPANKHFSDSIYL